MSMRPTPCHIVAGPLGVGKTSAILSHLQRQPAGARIGVLVNDFGPIGLDQARLGAVSPTTEVVNLQGGCICCTLLERLPQAVAQLTSSQQLDRLIIEPSGMASPAQAIQTLQQAEDDIQITLKPTIVLLSAQEFDEQMFERMPYYRMLCEVADVLVFNRCDRVDGSTVERIRQWSKALTPPKLRVVFSAHGDVPADLFDDPADHRARTPNPLEQHTHQFDATAHASGVVMDAAHVFDERALLHNLGRLSERGISSNQVLRFKGVFNTDKGWQSFDIVNTEVSQTASADHDGNRLEWVTRPGLVEPQQMLMEIQRPLSPAGHQGAY